MTTDTPVSALTDDALRELVDSLEDRQDALMLLVAGGADAEALQEAKFQLSRCYDAQVELVCRGREAHCA